MLSGRLAFVTGAASGIGKATCQVLAREGASIIAADINLAGAEGTVQLLSQQSKEKHVSLPIDVSLSSSVRSALENVLEMYQKPPSIVANCAGIIIYDYLAKLAEPAFDELVSVNLKGTYLVMQMFSQAIIEHGVTNASIINIGSIIGKTGSVHFLSYGATKAGVELLTKTAAKELGKTGIRVNVIAPGYIKTPMSEGAPEEERRKFIDESALRRLGEPPEVAEVVAFLASDRSSFVNGATIEVNGGM